MKFDYLQGETDLPYIETTAPRKHGLWIVVGIVLCVSLIGGVKLYISRTPSTTQAETPEPLSASHLPLALEMSRAAEASQLTPTDYDQIQRDPFQSSQRRQAVKRVKQAVHKKVTQAPVRPPRSNGQVPLSLKAVVLGAHPKAFINDELVGEGQSFDIGASKKVTCQVISIDEQVVKVKVGQKIRVLRLASDVVTDKNPWRF